jgi:hypothetical protein
MKEINYITADDFLHEIYQDFEKYHNDDLIKPQQLIKTIKYVTYDLGLRIYKTKENLVTISNGKSRLPDDFFSLNYALICASRTVNTAMPSGTRLEERLIPSYSEYPEVADPCSPTAINCETTVCDTSTGITSGGCSTAYQDNFVCDTVNVNSNTTDTTEVDGDPVIVETSTYESTCISVALGNAVKGSAANTTVAVIIDGDYYIIKPGGESGDENTLADALNALGLGTWTVTVSGSNYELSVTTSIEHDYEKTESIIEGTKSFVEFYCNTTSTTDTTTTSTNTITNDNTVTNDSTVTCVNPCVRPMVYTDCNDDNYEVVQIVNSGLSYTYSTLIPLKLKSNGKTIECGCPNLYVQSANEGFVKNGFLYTSFTEGTVYLNYQGSLEDEEGNLLIPDNEYILRYYEYAIKKKILESLIMSDHPVGNKLEYISMELRAARNNALSIVNMPEFDEIKNIYNANRKVTYNKYFDMFKSY